MNFFRQVYRLTTKIPKGKVTTYGAIAKALGTRNSRLVGWALHGNTSSQVPCHRVVFKDGGLAPHYVFGGEKEQRRRLVKEGVKFTKLNRVDLKNFAFLFNQIKKCLRKFGQRGNHF